MSDNKYQSPFFNDEIYYDKSDDKEIEKEEEDKIGRKLIH
jgi:hypothetical protein